METEGFLTSVRSAHCGSGEFHDSHRESHLRIPEGFPANIEGRNGARLGDIKINNDM